MTVWNPSTPAAARTSELPLPQPFLAPPASSAQVNSAATVGDDEAGDGAAVGAAVGDADTGAAVGDADTGAAVGATCKDIEKKGGSR